MHVGSGVKRVRFTSLDLPIRSKLNLLIELLTVLLAILMPFLGIILLICCASNAHFERHIEGGADSADLKRSAWKFCNPTAFPTVADLNILRRSIPGFLRKVSLGNVFLIAKSMPIYP